MYIKKLELINFRNYKELSIEFNRNTNLILGKNAQGKTNLIEAIFITSLGKSFRTNKENEMVLFEEDFAKIKVFVEKDAYETIAEVIIKQDGKKFIKKDGIPIKKTSDLINNILVVCFSPDDLKIVKEEPEKRRKFIDRELCQIMPSYYDDYVNYKKSLLQRNAYLKEKQIDSSILDIWDVSLSKYGGKIIYKREKFIKRISLISNEIQKQITNNKENLVLEYLPNVKVAKSILEQQEVLYKKTKESFNNDLRLRTTTRGPHKDDFTFMVNNVNMRSFGSQGQQRTCALSLKLAELKLIKEETGENPILLLDDVMSELDLERQEFLLETLKDNQVFITSTSIEEQLKNTFQKNNTYYVKKGEILKK